MARALLLSSYGLPGSGKTHFLKRYAQQSGAFYFQFDQYRSQVHDNPDFSMTETRALVRHVNPIISSLLEQGLSVVYDTSLNSPRARRQLSQLASEAGAEFLMVWFEVDEQTALERLKHRQHVLDGKWSKDQLEIYRLKQQRNSEPEKGEYFIKLDAAQPYEKMKQQLEAELN